MAFPCMRAEAVLMLLPIMRSSSRDSACSDSTASPGNSLAAKSSQTLDSFSSFCATFNLWMKSRRARPMNAPWTPPESPRCAPRPPGLGADRWLLAAETLPTHQKFVLHRVSGEKEFLMRWPYPLPARRSAFPGKFTASSLDEKRLPRQIDIALL